MIEERAIGFDEDVTSKAYVSLEEGIYQFTYLGYAQGNTNPKDGGISWQTGIAKLKARNILTGAEVETEETFIMTTKWEWKMASFWRSLGAEEVRTPDGTKVPQGWSSRVGQRGYFEVTKTAAKDGRKRDDGTPVIYTNKNFIDPARVDEVIEKWKNKQPVPQAQSASPWGGKSW